MYRVAGHMVGVSIQEEVLLVHSLLYFTADYTAVLYYSSSGDM